MVALGQHTVVEGDRRLGRVAQALATGVLAAGPLRDLDAGAGGEAAQRLGKVDPVALHDEVEDVPAAAAAEALPGLARRGNRERGRLLVVERTEPLEAGARLAQG